MQIFAQIKSLRFKINFQQTIAQTTSYIAKILTPQYHYS